MTLKQLVGLLSSTIQAIFPAQTQFHWLQLQKYRRWKEQCLKRKNYFKRSRIGEIRMVDRKPKLFQREVSNSGQAWNSNKDRCFTARLGCQLHAYKDWRQMVCEREKTSYPKTSICEEWHYSFHKNENNQCNSKSSRLQMFFKIGVLKNFAIFTGKHLCWNLF